MLITTFRLIKFKNIKTFTVLILLSLVNKITSSIQKLKEHEPGLKIIRFIYSQSN